MTVVRSSFCTGCACTSVTRQHEHRAQRRGPNAVTPAAIEALNVEVARAKDIFASQTLAEREADSGCGGWRVQDVVQHGAAHGCDVPDDRCRSGCITRSADSRHRCPALRLRVMGDEASQPARNQHRRRWQRSRRCCARCHQHHLPASIGRTDFAQRRRRSST